MQNPTALDYPPFFAYFEWLLSIPASIFDPKIVDLQNLNYDSWSVVVYQRSTVIVTELVLAAALLRYARLSGTSVTFSHCIISFSFTRGVSDPTTQRIISASIFLHPGFLIVDHIHFQYNGFMFGILVWSILSARNVRIISFEGWNTHSTYSTVFSRQRATFWAVDSSLQCFLTSSTSICTLLWV